MLVQPPSFYDRSRFIDVFINIRCEFIGRKVMLETEWSSCRLVYINTGYTQKNGAVSKVNKCISQPTRAQRTPSVAPTVQLSHALRAVRFSCLLRGRGASFQDGVATGKGFLCALSWGVQICDYSAARSGHLKTEHTESLFLLRRHFGNWPRSKHEKRTAGSAWETWTVGAADGVRCARVRCGIDFLFTFEIASFFYVYPVCVCVYIYIYIYTHTHTYIYRVRQKEHPNLGGA